MRWIACPLLFILLAGSQRELAAQLAPPAVDLPAVAEEELRAIPDEVPTTPAVLPAVYSRTVRNTRPSTGISRGTSVSTSTEMAIPVGKFGLKLNDGTRLIGLPDKRWPVMLKTGFGTSTIPLDLILAVTAQKSGTVVVHLKNGDRITGQLLVQTIPYITKFGRLTVPSTALVSLERGVPGGASRKGRIVHGRRSRPATGPVPHSHPGSIPPAGLPGPPTIADPSSIIIESSSVTPFDTRVIRR